MPVRALACAAALALSACALPASAGVLLTGPAGGNQPIDNMQPSLALNYLVRLDGTDGLGEVRLFAGNFAPGGFASANGQMLPIAQYEPLFNLIGTTYGGDGESTFALPDLRGRVAVHRGVAPGGATNYELGLGAGVETVTLSNANLATHSHALPPSPTGTGAVGGGQPFSTVQPSLPLHYSVALQGEFPSRNGGSGAPWIGQVRLRAGTQLAPGEVGAQGQLLPINTNQAPFSVMGDLYGGDARTNFAVPNLSGRAAMGAGEGPGLTNRPLGQATGDEQVALNVAHLPPHAHQVPLTGGTTDTTGGGQPHSTVQPSLPLNYVIATTGIFPSREGQAPDEAMVGELRLFAGNFAPAGFEFADGRALQISQNTALYSILEDTYGGDGVTTFRLPDLRGRVPVHFGQGPGLSDRILGQVMGAEYVTLSESQMPTHAHTYVPEPSAALLAGSAAGLALRRRRRE